jgi:hypothetical protein
MKITWGLVIVDKYEECLHSQIASMSHAMHPHDEWHIVLLHLHYDTIPHSSKHIDSTCAPKKLAFNNAFK